MYFYKNKRQLLSKVATCFILNQLTQSRNKAIFVERFDVFLGEIWVTMVPLKENIQRIILEEVIRRCKVMIISYKAKFHPTTHLIDRLNERIKWFESISEVIKFCKRALVGRETSYSIYSGTKKSKVISDDLVFILDTTDPWDITIITVYIYEEYLNQYKKGVAQ